MDAELDYEMRLVAIDRVRSLSDRYDDIVPLEVLREGFEFAGQRISFGSFYSGIFRPRQMRGPAALSLTTTPPKSTRGAPYDDGLDESTNSFVYHYRTAQGPSARAIGAAEADNRSLRAAARLSVPLIYFHGIAPGQYAVVAPAFVTRDDPVRRVVALEVAMFVGDASPLGGGEVVGSGDDRDLRRYATREALVRLHQQRFQTIVLHDYQGRCAICALRESALLQAAHILEDRDPRGIASVVNGIAMCAIHHLAYDRNLMGIDPEGVVHVTARLLKEQDGPMLRAGLQGFHGAAILQRAGRGSDPTRHASRFATRRSAPLPDSAVHPSSSALPGAPRPVARPTPLWRVLLSAALGSTRKGGASGRPSGPRRRLITMSPPKARRPTRGQAATDRGCTGERGVLGLVGPQARRLPARGKRGDRQAASHRRPGPTKAEPSVPHAVQGPATR